MTDARIARHRMRIWRLDGTVAEAWCTGLSHAVAEHPQAWRVEFADEADRRTPPPADRSN